MIVTEILVTKRISYLETLQELLRDTGHLVYAAGLDEKTLLPAVRDATVIVATKGAQISRKVIDAAHNLQIVATPSAGYEWIDVPAATDAGVPVIANTGTAADTVANFTIGLVIALTRRIVSADRMLRSGAPYAAVRDHFASGLRGSAPPVTLPERFARWPGTGTELDGATVGIIGLGAIGSAVARKMRALFPVQLLGYDPHVNPAVAHELGITLVTDLLSLCQSADLLLIHSALTEETQGLVDRRMLAAMKPTAYLVNCARGALVDEAALVDALQARNLAGAAVDVFQTEPLPRDHPLLQLDNVILTPHIAGLTAESDRRRAEAIADRIKAVLSGTKPTGLLNPAVWPKYASRLNA